MNKIILYYIIYPEQVYNSETGHFVWLLRSPGSWNIPLDIRSAPTLSTFKNMLKTSFLTFLLHWQSTSSEHCTAPL